MIAEVRRETALADCFSAVLYRTDFLTDLRLCRIEQPRVWWRAHPGIVSWAGRVGCISESTKDVKSGGGRKR